MWPGKRFTRPKIAVSKMHGQVKVTFEVSHSSGRSALAYPDRIYPGFDGTIIGGQLVIASLCCRRRRTARVGDLEN